MYAVLNEIEPIRSSFLSTIESFIEKCKVSNNISKAVVITAEKLKVSRRTISEGM